MGSLERREGRALKWNLGFKHYLHDTWNALGLVRPGELVLDLNTKVVLALSTATVKPPFLIIGLRGINEEM